MLPAEKGKESKLILSSFFCFHIKIESPKGTGETGVILLSDNLKGIEIINESIGGVRQIAILHFLAFRKQFGRIPVAAFRNKLINYQIARRIVSNGGTAPLRSGIGETDDIAFLIAADVEPGGLQPAISVVMKTKIDQPKQLLTSIS